MDGKHKSSIHKGDGSVEGTKEQSATKNMDQKLQKLQMKGGTNCTVNKCTLYHDIIFGKPLPLRVPQGIHERTKQAVKVVSIL